MNNILLSIVPCLLIVSINGGLLSPGIETDPEVTMDVNEVIKYYGYPLETHQVTTEDGYILTMQRIPYGRTSSPGIKKPVVFLQHGLLDSSFTWVNNGPEKSLAFILADRGFDVWLGNSRGNTYSRKHTKFSPFSKFFWDFTWDEMAQFDLPASINYALTVSKADKLGYIGHSQGTEIGFAKFSQFSDLNSKVSAFVALAPVVYLGNLKTAIKYIAGLGDAFNVIMRTVTTGEFLPNIQLVNAMSKFVCGDQMGSLGCGNVAFLLQGYNVENLNYTRMPIYVTHIPAGTSTKNIAHYAQSHLSNKFQKFDYGFFMNKLKYNQITPPQYPLDTHGLPVAMFYGGNDWMAVKEDVTRAIGELGQNVKLIKFIPEYNHIDFIWGANAYTKIYPDVIDFLLKYNN